MDHWQTEKRRTKECVFKGDNNDGNIELQSSHLYHIEETEDFMEQKKREKNVVVGIPRLRLFLYDTYVVFPLQSFPGKFSESKKWSTKLYTRQ